MIPFLEIITTGSTSQKITLVYIPLHQVEVLRQQLELPWHSQAQRVLISDNYQHITYNIINTE